MSIIGILKIMEVQEDDMEVQEEAVYPVMYGVNVGRPALPTLDCFFLHLHIIFLHLHILGKFTI